MTDARTLSWGEVIRKAVVAGMLEMHVSMPAVVEAYDATKQTVDVVPLLMFPTKDAAGTITLQAPKKLTGVPVVFQGGGGLRMTLPVKPGDFVTLLCADRSIDVWKGNASAAPVDPGVDALHSLADAVAFVGLRAPSKPWTGADTAAITIGTDGAAFQGTGLGHAIRTELDAIWAAIYGGHFHPGVTAGAGVTGAAAGSPSKQTVESASVKVSP